jgi:hypothetical protein
VITFKQFVHLGTEIFAMNEEEQLINRGLNGSVWVLRTLKNVIPTEMEFKKFAVLKNAVPWIDEEALKNKEPVSAYLKGEDVTDEIGKVDTTDGEKIIFDRKYISTAPFRYSKSKKEFIKATYAVFTDDGVFALDVLP